MVYPEFSRHLHVVPTHQIPDNVLLLGSIDPGTRHMAAVLWAYLSAGDDLVVFDELAMREATVAEVCRSMLRVEAHWKVKLRTYMIDPAARNMMHQTGRSDQMEYTDHGVVTILGQNDVPAGINRLKERLQAQPPRLHVMAHCENLIDEFRRYHWTKQGRSEHEAKEMVVKKDDHLLDALRYMVMSRPTRPDPLAEERWMDPMNRAAFRERKGSNWNRRPRSHEYGGIFH
jgi:hypothetical protein